MDNDREISEKSKTTDARVGEVIGVTQIQPHDENQAETGPRIHFIPSEKPTQGRIDDDVTSMRRRSRSRSVHSIPALPQKPKPRGKGKKGAKDEEEKNVDITEHLLPFRDVADKYHTLINVEKPGDSPGLTSLQAQQLLQEHGHNVLTPPSRRHPFLKFLDSLTSLFNLLLIVAGILEYILLGINYKNNFQNVSLVLSSQCWSIHH